MPATATPLADHEVIISGAVPPNMATSSAAGAATPAVRTRVGNCSAISVTITPEYDADSTAATSVASASAHTSPLPTRRSNGQVSTAKQIVGTIIRVSGQPGRTGCRQPA